MSHTPQRIQRRRTRGWRMPDGAVYVGRPTKWGNPFRVVESTPRAEAVERYRALLRADGRLSVDGWEYFYPSISQARAELADRDLVCWCPLDQPCHADVLLEVANGGVA